MPCQRHSYPKGSTLPRQCRNCDHVDGGMAATVTAMEAGASVPIASTNVPAVLPEHSPLGASSAERWMNCSGSVALIAALKTGDGQEREEPDYLKDGVQAHALAAECLGTNTDAWEGADTYPDLTEDMMTAVQVYLDFVRGLSGRERYVELKLHRPEFHPLAFGTLDFATIVEAKDEADFVDYKHGAGVFVKVERNPQLMYYVYLFIGENREDYPDDMLINIHVVQPRCSFGEPIRSRGTTAGEIRKWAHEELRPAMDDTIGDRYLDVGEHCRFCPAKLVCPAMRNLAKEMVHYLESDLRAYSLEGLVDFYEKTFPVQVFINAVRAETERRILSGEKDPRVIAVKKRSNRVWKRGAPLDRTYGMDAYAPREYLTPPGVEKLADGKAFVAEWAFQPDIGMTIALASSGKTPVAIKSGSDTFGAALKSIGRAIRH